MTKTYQQIMSEAVLSFHVQSVPTGNLGIELSDKNAIDDYAADQAAREAADKAARKAEKARRVELYASQVQAEGENFTEIKFEDWTNDCR